MKEDLDESALMRKYRLGRVKLFGNFTAAVAQESVPEILRQFQATYPDVKVVSGVGHRQLETCFYRPSHKPRLLREVARELEAAQQAVRTLTAVMEELEHE